MGLKKTLQKAAMLGAMVIVSHAAFDYANNKYERDNQSKIVQTARDYSHLINRSKCVSPDDAKYLESLLSLIARSPTGKMLLDNIDKLNYSISTAPTEENTVLGHHTFQKKEIVLFDPHPDKLACYLYVLAHETEHARHVSDLENRGISVDSFQSADDILTFRALEEAAAEMNASRVCMELMRLPQANVTDDALYQFQQGVKQGQLEVFSFPAMEQAIKDGKSLDEAAKEVFFTRYADSNINGSYSIRDSHLDSFIDTAENPFAEKDNNKVVRFELNPDWNQIASLVTAGEIDKVPENSYQLEGISAISLIRDSTTNDFSSINPHKLLDDGDVFLGYMLATASLKGVIERAEQLSPEERQSLLVELRKGQDNILNEESNDNISNAEIFIDLYNQYHSIRDKMDSMKITSDGSLEKADKYMEFFKEISETSLKSNQKGQEKEKKLFQDRNKSKSVLKENGSSTETGQGIESPEISRKKEEVKTPNIMDIVKRQGGR